MQRDAIKVYNLTDLADTESNHVTQTVEVLRVEIAKLELKPTDWVVLKVKEDLSQEQTYRFSEQAKAILNHDRVMVLSGHVDLTVLEGGEGCGSVHCEGSRGTIGWCMQEDETGHPCDYRTT